MFPSPCSRLAMVGFLAALGAEFGTGETVSQQLISGGVGTWMAAVFVLFSLGSLVPMLKGVQNDKAFGPFTPYAELANGEC